MSVSEKETLIDKFNEMSDVMYQDSVNLSQIAKMLESGELTVDEAYEKLDFETVDFVNGYE